MSPVPRQQGVLALDVRFTLSLTVEEFRIVSRALAAAGGARPFPDEPDQKARALALQADLWGARQKQVAAWASSIVKDEGIVGTTTPSKETPK